MLWFKRKKKPTADEELKARLAESLKNYVAEEPADATNVTNTTYTDVQVEGRTVRVPKIRAKKIEELTLTEFEHDVTVVGLDRTAFDKSDPWDANPADNTQWHRARKHGG